MFPSVFSRGTATGGGTTRESNQRLALAWQSFEWESSPEHNGKGDDSAGGGSAASGVPLLDAAIVGEMVCCRCIYEVHGMLVRLVMCR